MNQGQSQFIEDISCTTLAKQYGTPLYVYSKKSMTDAFFSYQKACEGFDHLICYAVKANSNLSVLSLLAKRGAGFDIVSLGELQRVIRAGGDPRKVVFSGVGKTRAEIRGALEANIYCFNVESEAELHMLNEIACEMNVRAPFSLRVNPDVDAKTHPYISTGLRENKFGVSMHKALELYKIAAQMKHIEIKGIDAHIGSQLVDLSPYSDALDLLIKLVDTLASEGIVLSHIDMGGGVGIKYEDETLITPKAWVDLAREKIGARSLKLVVEPGRAIVGDAGFLLTEVILTKENEGKHFAVVDAAMNDLIRPSLYEAWMRIENVEPSQEATKNYDVVGPICETSDFLGQNRALSLKQGDILVVKQAGAYGFSMSSNYNTRGRAAEILVDGQKSYIIRERETINSLIDSDILL